jgi:hypothetical protein
VYNIRLRPKANKNYKKSEANKRSNQDPGGIEKG